MSLFDQIKQDMYSAMKAGEKGKATTLRTTFSKLKDRQIEKREPLTASEEIKVLQSLVKQRKESIDLYMKGGRTDLAEVEKDEISILESYLPSMMSESEIRNLVESVIKEVGATSMSDIRKIMPEVMKRGKGLVDGKIAQACIRETLN